VNLGPGVPYCTVADTPSEAPFREARVLSRSAPAVRLSLMTRMRRPSFGRLATMLACLSLAAPATAQQYSFRYCGAEDGLTNAAVKVLLQDRTGFIWAGTENGLFRYDGQRFQRYGPVESLPHDVVLSLGETPDGRSTRREAIRRERDKTTSGLAQDRIASRLCPTDVVGIVATGVTPPMSRAVVHSLLHRKPERLRSDPMCTSA
jgi:hypothetical protein